MYKFVCSDHHGAVYAVAADGDLFFFRENTSGALPALEKTATRIGSGWADFINVFASGEGTLYAVQADGSLKCYRDQAHDGTENWKGGQVIASGWNEYLHIVSGGDGVIYTVSQNGDLKYHKDLSRDGTVNWDPASGSVIGNGWGSFMELIGHGDGIIYALAENGELRFYRDVARSGAQQWEGISGPVIGAGFQIFQHLFSTGNGRLYAATTDGFLQYYQDLVRDGTVNWANSGIGQTVASGWIINRTFDTSLCGYCFPLSGAAGDTIDFKIQTAQGCTVNYMRLKQHYKGSIGDVKGASFHVPPTTQITQNNCSAEGCGWNTTFSLQIPADWPSGMYAAQLVDVRGNKSHVVFIVKPLPTATHAKIAVLANINTWNAYNAFGGHSKYTSPPATKLSFLRPNSETAPFGDGTNHLTRAELWILNWMEDQGFIADVYSDRDFHNGISGLNNYRVLVLNTHPEYWTMGMFENLTSYIQGGGHVLYLGANGVYEEVDYNSTGDNITLFHGNQGEAREKSFFRNRNPPRPERDILGVQYMTPNWNNYSSFEVKMASHRFFTGTNLADGDEMGQEGINGGGASGWEMDSSIAGNVSYASINDNPPNIVPGAWPDSDRGVAPSNLQLLARGKNPGYGGDMTYYETSAGGFVFCAGSLSFGGSLMVDDKLQIIMKNVLNAAVGQ